MSTDTAERIKFLEVRIEAAQFMYGEDSHDLADVACDLVELHTLRHSGPLPYLARLSDSGMDRLLADIKSVREPGAVIEFHTCPYCERNVSLNVDTREWICLSECCQSSGVGDLFELWALRERMRGGHA